MDIDPDLLKSLKKLKTPVFAISILLGVVGIMLTIVLAFIANGVIQNTHEKAILQINAASGIMKSVENSLGAAAESVGQANTTIADLKDMMNSLKTGVTGTGAGLTDLGNSLKTINLGIISFSSYGTQISDAGSSISETAVKIDIINKDFDVHADNIAGLKTQIESVKESVAAQNEALASAKTAANAAFDGLKLANIILAIMFFLMFSMLILNAVGGVL